MDKKKILICDDHLVCCLGLRVELENLLGPARHDYVFASSVRKAIEQIHEADFDLVFMDLKFPDGSGLDVIRQMQERLEGARLILVTGDNSVPALDAIRDALQSLPISAVIQKTHTLEAMGELVEALGLSDPKSDRLATPYLCAETQVLMARKCHTDLTRREEEVMRLVVRGLTTPEIASELGLSHETIKSHRSNMLLKTKTRNFAELSAWYSSRYGQMS